MPVRTRGDSRSATSDHASVTSPKILEIARESRVRLPLSRAGPSPGLPLETSPCRHEPRASARYFPRSRTEPGADDVVDSRAGSPRPCWWSSARCSLPAAARRETPTNRTLACPCRWQAEASPSPVSGPSAVRSNPMGSSNLTGCRQQSGPRARWAAACVSRLQILGLQEISE